MTRSSITPTVEQQQTRRQVLAGLASLGVAGGASTVASGQADDVITRGAIPEQQQYDQTVTGFWIHVGGPVDPGTASVADECAYLSWPDEQTRSYDVRLIDRRADPRQTRTTLYLHEDVEIAPGTLFIVNKRHQCQSGYVGVGLERIGVERGLGPAPARQTPVGGGAPPATTSGDGAGFGVLGTLASVLGVGWWLRRERDE